ncbi:flagellar hook-basal body complex protein FliE [Paenibacillus sp. CAA11]|uniref:flagellar hook-basal body complex protein FliE n=1 Tax=Paenibacillus sp. CAA11 TaxID=1532905 RepID=UPI000D340045|nr:flagellar hook-basal body complex protein FliE [Paenibacillus sp. CAA11]AWB44291.1 flagellar hook-basal body complex protein FliE [Paenibacillus sp. CAA11]
MIQNISSALQPLQAIKPETTGQAATPAETIKDFGSYLKDAIDGVAGQEQNVEKLNNQFLLGEVDVDQVMVASEQALLSLQLTSQVRNKVIEAYQEIMRTQM